MRGRTARVELRVGDTTKPFSLVEKHQQIQAEIVENKRLGPALALIQAKQIERDTLRGANKKLTKRQKDRILTADQVRTPLASGPDISKWLKGGHFYLAFTPLSLDTLCQLAAEHALFKKPQDASNVY